jgi:hypothetical protein
MKYTNIDNLTIKLSTRLKLAADVLFPTNTPGIDINSELALLVIDEKENYLDLILQQICELPLQNSHPILSEIIEALVISEFLMVYFQGSGGLSGDQSGMGVAMKNQAMTLITMITAGHNILLPGIPQTPVVPGYRSQKRRKEKRNKDN